MTRSIYKILFERTFFGDSLNNYIDYIETVGKTFIFFDTETTGLNQKEDQITQISAIACDGTSDNFAELETFSAKLSLNDDIKNRMISGTDQNKEWIKKYASDRFKEPVDVLRMTRYGERHGKYSEEKSKLREFIDWIVKFEDPVLVAQNSKFDMKFLSRAGIKNIYPVMDTMVMLRLFFLPILRKLSKQYPKKWYKKRDSLLKPKRTGKGKYYSVSLGTVAPILGINIEGWHDALADVRATIELVRKIYLFLKENKDIDESDDEYRNYKAQSIKFLKLQKNN
jgi:DNA polymerase III epsilon subunit-like protein